MPSTVVCSRCEQEKPGLPSAPMGGPAGQLVLERVCAECWAEWREMSPRIISHYGLVMGNPHHRAQMRQVMREFLGLDGEDAGREAGS
jgi:Fe-S cluster biosynthesis and repair protein YggX